jgi:hypothetical protein
VALDEQPIGNEPHQCLQPARLFGVGRSGAHVLRQTHYGKLRRENLGHLRAQGAGLVNQSVGCVSANRSIQKPVKNAASVVGAPPGANSVNGACRRSEIATGVKQAFGSLKTVVREPRTVGIVEFDRVEQPAIAAQATRQAKGSCRVSHWLG